MKQRLIIIGTGGHAKVVAEAVELQGKYKIEGFVSSEFKRTGDSFIGYPILGDMTYLRSVEYVQVCYFIAIGDNNTRKFIEIEYLCGKGLAKVVHPSATISEKATIEDGCFIAANAHIGVDVKIERNSIINTAASVDHDCVIGQFSSIAPRAVLGGNVSIGFETAIGIGATLKHKVKVGNYSVVGAGSVVVKDVPDNVVAYGNPCKVIRPRQPHENYL